MATEMQYKYYPYLLAVFCVVLVLSNTTAVKMVSFGPLVATSAMILFPITYVMGDVITEVYGYRKARPTFWTGVAANALMAVVYMATARMKGVDPDFDPMYARVLGQVPRIVIASMIGIWMGQFSNSIVMSKMKIVTKGKWMPLRTISSTLVGEFVDTLFFATIGFAFLVPWPTLVRMLYTAPVAKCIYEIAVTPLTVWLANVLKRAEGVDVFDIGISYNPFAVVSNQVPDLDTPPLKPEPYRGPRRFG